jgi:hypothetical protein
MGSLGDARPHLRMGFMDQLDKTNQDNGGNTMKITEKYLAGEMVEIVTRGGSVARQRRIARVTKTLVILDNGRRYRKKGGTDVSFKWSYDSIFYIRPAPMTTE